MDKRLRNISAALDRNVTPDNYPEYTRGLFQDKVDNDYYYASDVYDFQNYNTATKTWENVRYRIAPSYGIVHGSSIKDDYKTVIFKDHNQPSFLGDMWLLDETYWMTIDTGRSKSSSASCQIQRCGDALRFYDDSGIYHEIPAIISRMVPYNLDGSEYMMLPMNQLRCLVPYIDDSKLIVWANEDSPTSKYSRFILQQYAYKAVSIDRHSFVRNNIGYIDVRLQSDLIRRGIDNLTDNIADDIQGVTVDILNGTTTIGIGQTLQLNASVKRNSIIIDNPTLTYVSSTPTFASVNSNGLVTATSSGTSTISATYAGISDSISVIVASVSNNYNIVFSSSTNNLTDMKINQQTTFSAIFTNNGTSYVDSGTWSVVADDGISSTSLASIVSQTGTQIVVKCANVSVNIGQYFKIKCVGTNSTVFIRLQVKSIF